MKSIDLIFLILFFPFVIYSQVFTNSGAYINIGEGAYLYGEDFISEDDGGTSGKIILNGNLKVAGDISNNSSGNFFIQIEDTPNGKITLLGDDNFIDGNNLYNFENVELLGKYTLNNSGNEIFGVFYVDGILNLNSNLIVLNNSSTSALSYNSGYILSETNQNYGIFRWVIGENIGSYNIPFGSGYSDFFDLLVTFDVTNQAISTQGYVDFATYPTTAQNTPLPFDVSSLSDYDALQTIDRFWLVEPVFAKNPEFDITFSYTATDVNLSENVDIVEDSLTIVRYNQIDDTWSDVVFPTSVLDGSLSTVFPSTDIYKWFTAVSKQGESETNIVIPNGITPNNDGYNDTWILEGFSNCTVYIYNRWGSKVYSSDNYDNQWDGDNNPSGPYYYTIITTDNETYNGVVNLLK